MFRVIRTRITPPTILATVALLFAMTGGAYAAKKYLITSTKQISPKVLSSLKGAKGAIGAAGTAGPAGPQGPSGPAGATGKEGPAGKEGTTGKEGAPGKEGTPGKEGSPWGTGTLPAGKTETGVWGETAPGMKAGFHYFPISFPVPVEGAPEPIFVGATEESKPGCPGRGGAIKPGIPQAEPGKLCVYAGAFAEVAGNPRFLSFENEEGTWVSGSEEAVSPAGTLMRVNCKFESEECEAEGSWAVTAE